MKTIRAEDIPANATVTDFISSLDFSQGELVLEQGGEPRVVLMSAESWRQRKLAKERFFTLLERIQARHPTGNSDDLLQELEDQESAGASA